MSKQFFDVFPTLKLNQKIQALFEEVEVTKVSTNAERDYLHVHIQSYHLIDKQSVYDMEKAIKEQLFAANPIRISIKESFVLSRQYIPENLLKEYRESILLELRRRSKLEYNMFVNAKYYFDEQQVLTLEFEDNIVAEGKTDLIVALLKEVFEVRCNMKVEIRVT